MPLFVKTTSRQTRHVEERARARAATPRCALLVPITVEPRSQSPMGTSRLFSSSQSLVPPRRTSRTPLFLPFPVFLPSPTLMAHVLIPPLLPGPRKSDYAPVEQQLRTCESRSAGNEQGWARHNSSSKELIHVLQNAFQSNWNGPGSTNTSPRKKMTKGTKLAKEIVVVVDDEGEKETNLTHIGETTPYFHTDDIARAKDDGGSPRPAASRVDPTFRNYVHFGAIILAVVLATVIVSRPPDRTEVVLEQHVVTMRWNEFCIPTLLVNLLSLKSSFMPTLNSLEKEVFLGALELVARQARKAGKRWRTTIEVQFLLDGKLQVSACESGQADRSTLTV
ncbi:hypothetical protein V8E53_005768 [Lactarius tabidus]